MPTDYIRTLAREYLELITLMTDPAHEADARRELSAQRSLCHDELIRILGPGHERDVFDMQAYCRQIAKGF